MEWSNAGGPDQHRDLELEPNAGPVPLSGHQPAQLLVQSPLGLLKGQHSPNFGLSEDQCLTVGVADGKPRANVRDELRGYADSLLQLVPQASFPANIYFKF